MHHSAQSLLRTKDLWGLWALVCSREGREACELCLGMRRKSCGFCLFKLTDLNFPYRFTTNEGFQRWTCGRCVCPHILVLVRLWIPTFLSRSDCGVPHSCLEESNKWAARNRCWKVHCYIFVTVYSGPHLLCFYTDQGETWLKILVSSPFTTFILSTLLRNAQKNRKYTVTLL